MIKKEIEKELDIARNKEFEEKELMNQLAMESIKNGVNFSDNHNLLRQSRIVDDCTVNVLKLEEMLKNCEE